MRARAGRAAAVVESPYETYLGILLTLAACLILTGCDETPSILSIDSVVTDKDSKSDPALAGTWESADDKGPLYIIRTSEKGGYDIICVETGGSAPLSFHAQLFRVGEAELLDLAPSEESDFRIPGHAFARIWTGGTLRWTLLHSDWLKQQAGKLFHSYAVGDRNADSLAGRGSSRISRNERRKREGLRNHKHLATDPVTDAASPSRVS